MNSTEITLFSAPIVFPIGTEVVEMTNDSDFQNLKVKFPNGRIASAARHDGTYGGKAGLWEVLDVTPLFGTTCHHYGRDVQGWLDVAAVIAEFNRIAAI